MLLIIKKTWKYSPLAILSYNERQFIRINVVFCKRPVRHFEFIKLLAQASLCMPLFEGFLGNFNTLYKRTFC